MAENKEKSVPNQEITYNKPPCSISIKLFSPGGADIIMTICSGATIEHVKELFDVFVGGAQYANQKYNIDFAPEKMPAPEKLAKTASAPASQPSSMPHPGSAPPPHSDSGPLFFRATGMRMEIKDGKKYFKIIGEPPFHKYGINIWDEVLEAAGWHVDSLNDYEYVFTDMDVTAYYVQKEKNGKMVNDKIVRLDIRQ